MYQIYDGKSSICVLRILSCLIICQHVFIQDDNYSSFAFCRDKQFETKILDETSSVESADNTNSFSYFQPENRSEKRFSASLSSRWNDGAVNFFKSQIAGAHQNNLLEFNDRDIFLQNYLVYFWSIICQRIIPREYFLLN